MPRPRKKKEAKPVGLHALAVAVSKVRRKTPPRSTHQKAKRTPVPRKKTAVRSVRKVKTKTKVKAKPKAKSKKPTTVRKRRTGKRAARRGAAEPESKPSSWTWKHFAAAAAAALGVGVAGYLIGRKRSPTPAPPTAHVAPGQRDFHALLSENAQLKEKNAFLEKHAAMYDA
jgi:hypothetical protein